MSFLRRALIACAAMLSVTFAFAQAPSSSGLTVEGAWLRATPGGAKVAAGYLTLLNSTGTTDRLLGGRVPFAGKVEIHEMLTSGGIMKMRPLADGLDVPAGGSAILKPGGYHLMFEELTAGLKEGETVQGTLLFQRAGEVPVTFRVGGLGGPPPGLQPR